MLHRSNAFTVHYYCYFICLRGFVCDDEEVMYSTEASHDDEDDSLSDDSGQSSVGQDRTSDLEDVTSESERDEIGTGKRKIESQHGQNRLGRNKDSEKLQRSKSASTSGNSQGFPRSRLKKGSSAACKSHSRPSIHSFRLPDDSDSEELFDE
jgi:hypothetical protein